MQAFSILGRILLVVFGMDGTPLCIPQSFVDSARKSLVVTKLMVTKTYGLELRPGSVLAPFIRRLGHDVLVARFSVSENFVQSVFSGSGFQVAEKYIKNTG